MFPGDGDPAVDLGVEVGAQVGGRRSEGGGHRGGVGELIATGGGGPGRVPHRAGGQLGGHGHVGAVVLDRLVHGDRATELLSLLGVRRGQVGALAGQPHGLGRQQHPGHVAQHLAAARDDGGGGGVERHPRRAAGGIEVGWGVDRDAVADLDDGDIFASRDEHEPGQATAQRHHRAGGGGVGDGHGAVDGHGGRRRAVGQTGQERLGRGVIAGRGQHRAGGHGGNERPGRDRPPQLLDHDDELLEPVAGAAVLLGHVEPQPAQLDEVVPEGRHHLVRGVEQGSGRGAGLVPAEEVRRGLGQ